MMDDRVKKHLPIDKGWAWVTCLGTCGLFGFISGSFKSSGVILVELREKFPEASATSLLWIFSLSSIVNRFSGILASLLLSRLTHRTVAILVVTLMSISIVSFGYSPTVGHMYLTYGIMYGMGSGMLSLTVFTAYTNYFDKKRALALGITSSGSGIGTICIPLFLRVLFNNLDFSSAILLYGGLAVQLLVLASLLRPISFYETLAKQRLRSLDKRNKWVIPTITIDEYDSQAEMDKGTNENESCLPTLVSRRHSEATPDAKFMGAECGDQFIKSAPSLFTTEHESSSQPHINRDNISVMFHSATDIAGSAMLNQPEDKSDSKNKGTKRFNWRVALRKESILMGLGIYCFSCGMGVVYQCIPPLGKSTGVSKETIALTLSIAGAIEIPARILNGILADRKLMSAISQLSLCMGLAGVAAVLCGSISGLPGIVIMLVTMSVCGTTVFNLIPIASGELLGQENVTTALGISMLYQSLAMLTAVFSAGHIYEVLRRWEYVYYFISAMMISGAAINASIAVYSWRLNRKQAHAEDSQSE